jgi:hypothetical protein
MANSATTFLQQMSQKAMLFLKRLLAWPWKRQATAPVEGAAPTDPAKGMGSLDSDDPYNQYNSHVSQLNDVVVKLGLHQRISAGHKCMYEMGRLDAALGVSIDNMADIAKAKAQEIFRHIDVMIKGRIAAKQADMETKKRIMEDDDLDRQQERAHFVYVKYQYRFFPRSHSWLLGLFYMIVAIALIIADIPLALKLIQEGFNLSGTGTGPQGFPYLFKGDFWSILALNWETVTTAMGIALCTVYIKIYYDDFVAAPYANQMMTFKRFVEDNNLNNEVLGQEGMHRNIKREYRGKRLWKTGLAIFTLLAILSLALFRLQTAGKSGEFDRTFVSDAAFVMITLLFPVIGGICLSHGFANWQNMVRLYSAKSKCKACRKKYLHSGQQYALSQKEYEDLAAAERRFCDEERMVNEYQGSLIAFYRWGFSTGGMQPEKYTKGEDFFNKILEWRNIAVSRRINHHINQLN